MKKSVLFAVSTVLLLSSAFSASITIEDKDAPVSLDRLSNSTGTVQTVRLVDDGEPVNNTELEQRSITFEYNFNDTETGDIDKNGAMQHLGEGYWYAELENNAKEAEIEYELTDGLTEINKTEQLQTGNQTVEILTGFSKSERPGKTYDLHVNVTDSVNEQWENQAAVEFYITNGTWTSDIYSLNNKDEEQMYYKYNDVSFPTDHGTRYVVHARASNDSLSYHNAYGTHSIVMEASPRLKGEIEYLEGGQCDDEMETCESNATVDIGFNVTRSDADRVETQVLLEKKDTGELEIYNTTVLDENSGVYNGTVMIPEINTTEYSKKAVLRVNATNDQNAEFTLDRELTYENLELDGPPVVSANQGEEAEIRLFLLKPFSHDSIQPAGIENGTANITKDGDSLASFNISDMDYMENDQYYRKNIQVSPDADPGEYSIEYVVYDPYSERRTFETSLKVKDVDATFNATELEYEINKTGDYRKNLTLTNLVDVDKEIWTNFSEEFEDIASIDGGENLTLNASETGNFPVWFNVSYVEDRDGELVLNDTETEFQEVVDVELETPNCDLRNETLCLPDHDDEWINVTRDERGQTTRLIEMIYLGERGTEEEIQVEITGDAASYVLPGEDSGFNITERKYIRLNYSAITPGEFTGRIQITDGDNTLEIPTRFESDVEATETSVEVTSDLDLGAMESGASTTEEITVENTGKTEIVEVSATSYDYTVSASSGSIAPGESGSVTLEISDITTSTGEVTLEAMSSEDSASKSVAVTADIVEDYSQKAENLRERINNLQEDAEGENNQDLRDLKTRIETVKTEYEKDNYESAKNEYDEIVGEVDSIEMDIGSADDNNGGNETTVEPAGEDEGGLPVIPIVAALVVFLLIGFVAYTSLIPEEGDPLYNVLGG